MRQSVREHTAAASPASEGWRPHGGVAGGRGGLGHRPLGSAQAKGVWRVDKDRPPQQRQTVLTLLAIDTLHELGDGHPNHGMASFLTAGA